MITYNKTFLNRPTTGPTLSGRFSDVVGLRRWSVWGVKISLWVIVWRLKQSDRYREVVDLWRWSVRKVLMCMVNI